MRRTRHCGLARTRLPFPSVMAASRHDTLGGLGRVAQLAHDRGSHLDKPGNIGHPHLQRILFSRAKHRLSRDTADPGSSVRVQLGCQRTQRAPVFKGGVHEGGVPHLVVNGRWPVTGAVPASELVHVMQQAVVAKRLNNECLITVIKRKVQGVQGKAENSARADDSIVAKETQALSSRLWQIFCSRINCVPQLGCPLASSSGMPG